MLDGFTNGFKIIDDVELFPVRMSNYKSATDVDVKQKVEKHIIAELDAGNYVITKEPPTLISALGAIPEPESEEVRLIHDCSRPKDNSSNSHITESESFSYQNINDTLKHIKHKSFLAKVDIRKAYRYLPLHPSNYCATGFSWEFKGALSCFWSVILTMGLKALFLGYLFFNWLL